MDMIEGVRAVEEKWQKIWEKKKVFESNPDRRKKFFATFPYPYINSAPHVGHAYTTLRNDMIARYKRMLGYNTLFPVGLHATGEPITGVAKRLAKNDASQIRALELSGIPKEEIPKFKDPLYIIKYFSAEWINDFKSLGLGVDWRRTFYTTSLNKEYNAFVTWQFNLLKEKGLVIKGKHPVVYCPSCDSPTQSHDRLEGENATIEEFTIIKFKHGDDYLVAATLRPETIYGATNVWVNPDVIYKRVNVDGEVWVLSEDALEKIRYQKALVNVVGEVSGSELIYDRVTSPITNKDIPVLPASFCKQEIGTGIVMSVPSDAPYDYVALQDLKAEIKPIPIIETQGLGDLPAKKVIEEMGIKNQGESDKLEQATKTVYKAGYHKGVLKKGEYAGVKVEVAREKIKKKMVKQGVASEFFQTSEPVVCRSMDKCFVKILDNQWFINYENTAWKKKTLAWLKEMKVYPEEARTWLSNSIKNCKAKACSRHSGLGTPLPWDEHEIIEPLSDSTIYMSYYTIAKYVHEGRISASNMTKEFFDYVLLNKGTNPYKEINLKKELVEEIKKEFEYFYPVDLRSTGKDLLSHHMIFFIYNHVAIFPKKFWPRMVGANGHITVDGMKMSKSKGNFVTLRQAINDYGADASRLTFLDSAEGIVDADFVRANASNFVKKFHALKEAVRQDVKTVGNAKKDLADKWLESRVQEIIWKTGAHLDEMQNRSALQHSFHSLLNIITEYKQLKEKANGKTLKYAWSVFARLNVPFTPHLCEEIWSILANNELVHEASWPTVKKSLVNKNAEQAIELYKKIKDDITSITKIVSIKPSSIRVIISHAWKYDFYSKLSKILEKENDVSAVIKKVMIQGRNEIPRIVQGVIADRTRMPQIILNQKDEREIISTFKSKLGEEFNAKIIVETADESKAVKASQATPGKPAIIFE